MNINDSTEGKKSWDDWSDPDVSKKITELKSKFLCDKLNYSVDESALIANKDYCNSPAAMWPIIFSKNISVINIKNTTQWFACTDVEFENICMSPDGSDSGISSMSANHNHYCTKPLRAAAIVFLEMNGVKP